MSKKNKKSIPVTNKKLKDKYFCGTIDGLSTQLNASNKLGRHSDIVRSGCGIIDNKEKARKKDEKKLKKYIDSFIK